MVKTTGELLRKATEEEIVASQVVAAELEYWAEQMRQDIEIVANYRYHAWDTEKERKRKYKPVDRILHDHDLHDQRELRTLLYHFYPCVLVDTMTTVMERWRLTTKPDIML